MLCRLNQELLPDPGNPMARTTVPFEARGAAPVVALAPPFVRCAVGEGTLSASPSLEVAATGPVLAGCAPPRPRPPLPRRRLRRGSALPLGRWLGRRAPAAASSYRAALWRGPASISGSAASGSANFGGAEGGSRGIVIGGLQRGLCRLALTGFRVLFGALETIAHPLAHVWFVTQLHIAGNQRQETYQSCQLVLVWPVWPRATRPRNAASCSEPGISEPGLPP